MTLVYHWHKVLYINSDNIVGASVLTKVLHEVPIKVLDIACYLKPWPL